ncbi:lytic murein transglycosylase [Dyella sp. LX-66]|uniref:DUF2268 domain-containing putative Zn-dependent protease n=1 Tax=unclassified Dyella TaxID=2634549 RepID=UPI001BE08083|nr:MULTISPECIES: DUF2268 domain-containing putative Zn-dependent protease [unclassified Dyella]MBT2118034.1 lytic murein transglycosylase [Dyella sp. LX-1]MBT2140941.1 lytic murein transglycosylase [Dyella sp. LX-66]
MTKLYLAIALFAAFCSSAFAADSTSTATPGPTIDVDDVYRFYHLYDATSGHPAAEQLQHDYLDTGSAGLHRLAELRKVTGEAIAKFMATQPAVYADAKRCMAVLPGARARLITALARFRQLYPPMEAVPTTVAVSRGKPVGVTDDQGVIIGLEALCAISYLEANPEDRFVHVMAHEYAHAQQARKSPAFFNGDKPTVLQQSLLEGAAEFVGEQVSGSVAYTGLPAMTKGREKELETAFLADQDKTDLSAWLYNGTLTKPGDIGYWVGYRIVKSYYLHAKDKRQAVRDILEMKDAKAFLAASGWTPGMRFP